MFTPLTDSQSEPGRVAAAADASLDGELPLAERRLRHWRLNLRWSAALLVVWALVAFGVAYFARPLSMDFLGWPFSFWVAAQGALMVFGVLVALYAVVMKRLDASVLDPVTVGEPPESSSH